MTAAGALQILAFFLVVLALTKPLGLYLFRVLEGDRPPFPRFFGPLERATVRLCGIDSTREQDWKEYTVSMLIFSAVTLFVTYGIERLQNVLPLNPQHFPAVPPALAMNTAMSFTTNTNWQNYAGESTMSDLTQTAGLMWHQFLSAAVGIAVAMAFARGLTRRPGPGGPKTIGNFWVDLVRTTLYVLLPLSFAGALFLVSQGVIQSFSPDRSVTTLEGARQDLPMGPIAAQEAIKELGTNGGGWLNANSAHPFENPTPLSNFFELVLIFALPSGIVYAFGKMAKDTRQGWALWVSMALLFWVGVGVSTWAEAHGNPAFRGLGVSEPQGNMEGKEVRFGVSTSALWAVATTDTSCGAVNAMHDSFTPLGGLVPLADIQLGEVAFGGVGSGLYGMLVFALMAVFIAGLMVGRTPEYLGKKIEAKEMKLVMLYVLVFCLLVLGFSGWASVAPSALASLHNAGPHGLSEILYASSSLAGNNGSAFAGLHGDTLWWNVSGTAEMFLGRFLMKIPVLALAGSMIGKKVVPPSLGTFPTNGATFVLLLVSVVVIVGALTFFPALSLGPVVEHFLAQAGRLF